MADFLTLRSRFAPASTSLLMFSPSKLPHPLLSVYSFLLQKASTSGKSGCTSGRPFLESRERASITHLGILWAVTHHVPLLQVPPDVHEPLQHSQVSPGGSQVKGCVPLLQAEGLPRDR